MSNNSIGNPEVSGELKIRWESPQQPPGKLKPHKISRFRRIHADDKHPRHKQCWVATVMGITTDAAGDHKRKRKKKRRLWDGEWIP
jgi:hypothetical protein